MRLTLTLALAAAIVGVIWQKLGPRLEDLPDSAVKPKPLDPAFVRLTPREMATLPLATRFDMPLGSEHGAFTYNARAFRIERHLGDDLNGIGGENSDLGDPVYAAGAGRVVYVGNPGPGWGKMILIAHRLPEGDEQGPVVLDRTQDSFQKPTHEGFTTSLISPRLSIVQISLSNKSARQGPESAPSIFNGAATRT